MSDLHPNNTQKQAPAKKFAASTALEGQTLDDFGIIREFMISRLPGYVPDNAAVLRFALHTAARDIEKINAGYDSVAE